jgi:N-acetylmuramoyl-L-alanine amidase
MTVHVVKHGEYLASIAKRYGYRDYRWIYDDPANAEFRRRRPDPGVILPGDEIVIPDLAARSVDAATEKNHRYRAKAPTVQARIAVTIPGRQDMGQLRYRLEIGSETFEGKTDDDGILTVLLTEHESGAIGSLTLPDLNVTWSIQVGCLDPLDVDESAGTVCVKGVQSRLNNLGCNCGDADGKLGPKTRAAIKTFQMRYMGKQNPSGELDAETRQTLKSTHGS